jgi:hypothetical protein
MIITSRLACSRLPRRVLTSGALIINSKHVIDGVFVDAGPIAQFRFALDRTRNLPRSCNL